MLTAARRGVAAAAASVEVARAGGLDRGSDGRAAAGNVNCGWVGKATRSGPRWVCVDLTSLCDAKSTQVVGAAGLCRLCRAIRGEVDTDSPRRPSRRLPTQPQLHLRPEAQTALHPQLDDAVAAHPHRVEPLLAVDLDAVLGDPRLEQLLGDVRLEAEALRLPVALADAAVELARQAADGRDPARVGGAQPARAQPADACARTRRPTRCGRAGARSPPPRCPPTCRRRRRRRSRSSAATPAARGSSSGASGSPCPPTPRSRTRIEPSRSHPGGSHQLPPRHPLRHRCLPSLRRPAAAS